MTLPKQLPRETDNQIQEILNSDFSIIKKSYQIEGYYQSLIPYNRTPGRIQEQPELGALQIRKILEGRGM